MQLAGRATVCTTCYTYRVQTFEKKNLIRIRPSKQERSDPTIFWKAEGGCTPLPHLLFAFTQNILRQPIPENSWPCKPFCCGCPYEEKNFKKIFFSGFSLSDHSLYLLLLCLTPKMFSLKVGFQLKHVLYESVSKCTLNADTLKSV